MIQVNGITLVQIKAAINHYEQLEDSADRTEQIIYYRALESKHHAINILLQQIAFINSIDEKKIIKTGQMESLVYESYKSIVDDYIPNTDLFNSFQEDGAKAVFENFMINDEQINYFRDDFLSNFYKPSIDLSIDYVHKSIKQLDFGIEKDGSFSLKLNTNEDKYCYVHGQLADSEVELFNASIGDYANEEDALCHLFQSVSEECERRLYNLENQR